MSIVFVHGTSVRPVRLYPLVDSIRQHLDRHEISESVAIYSYGQSSASLKYGGKSIPGLGENQMRDLIKEHEEATALPSLQTLLIGNPLLELATIAETREFRPVDRQFDMKKARSRALSHISDKAIDAIAFLLFELLGEEHRPKGAELAKGYVEAVWAEADAANTDQGLDDLQPIIGRALTALLMSNDSLLESNPRWIDIETKLVVVLTPVFARAFPLPKIIQTPLLWGLTGGIKLARGVLMPKVVAFVGDILYYLSHREAILNGLHAIVLAEQKKGEKVTLVAHSLGGIISLDYCSRYPTRIKLLVTAGTQIGLVAEGDLLYERNPDERTEEQDDRPRAALSSDGRRLLPGGLLLWDNVYDLNDFLSFRADPIFDGVVDHCFDMRTPFPDVHGEYWEYPAFYDLLKKSLAQIAKLSEQDKANVPQCPK